MKNAGFDITTIIKSVIVKGMNADDINTLIRNMNIDRDDNEFMKAFESVRDNERLE